MEDSEQKLPTTVCEILVFKGQKLKLKKIVRVQQSDNGKQNYVRSINFM